MTQPLTISTATAENFDDIWAIFHRVVATGDSFIYPPETTKGEAEAIWMHGTMVYIAKQGDKVVGTYVIRANKIGLGSHVCNAGFMIHPDHRGHGYGKMLCEHALKEARNAGYLSMQFNVVVSTNERAIKLWKSMGFKIIGTIPEGFQHLSKGLVDIHIMHRVL